MINRDSRGHSYFIVRGEILGFMKDEQLLRKGIGLKFLNRDVAVDGNVRKSGDVGGGLGKS